MSDPLSEFATFRDDNPLKSWAEEAEALFPPEPPKPAPEPSFGGAFNRGMGASRRGLYSTQYTLGQMDEREFVQGVLESQEEDKRFPAPPEVIQAGKSLGEGNFSPLIDPQFVMSTLGESIPGSLASAGLGLAGATAGSFAGPAGAIAGGLGGIALGSGTDEYGRSFLDYLKRESKVNEWDEHSLHLALADQNLVSEAIWYAAKRGGLVGAFDAIGAGVGGKVASKLLQAPVRWRGAKAAGSGVGIEGMSGAAGEASAQAVTEDKINWAEVAAEGTLELVAGAPEIALAAKIQQNGPEILSPQSTQKNEITQEDLEGLIQETEESAFPEGEITAPDIEELDPEEFVSPEEGMEVEGTEPEVSEEVVTGEETSTPIAEDLEEFVFDLDPPLQEEEASIETEVDSIDNGIQPLSPGDAQNEVLNVINSYEEDAASGETWYKHLIGTLGIVNFNWDSVANVIRGRDNITKAEFNQILEDIGDDIAFSMDEEVSPEVEATSSEEVMEEAPPTPREEGAAILDSLRDLTRKIPKAGSNQKWMEYFRNSLPDQDVNWTALEEAMGNDVHISRTRMLAILDELSTEVSIIPDDRPSTTPGEVEETNIIQLDIPEEARNPSPKKTRQPRVPPRPKIPLASFRTSDRMDQTGGKVLYIEDVADEVLAGELEGDVTETAWRRIFRHAKKQGYKSVALVQTLGASNVERAQKVAKSLGHQWGIDRIDVLDLDGDEAIIEVPVVILNEGETFSYQPEENAMTVIGPSPEVLRNSRRPGSLKVWVRSARYAVNVAIKIAKQFKFSKPVIFEIVWDINDEVKGRASSYEKTYHIKLNIAQHGTLTDFYATIMHEIGHVFAWDKWDAAPIEVQQAIIAEYAAYGVKFKRKGTASNVSTVRKDYYSSTKAQETLKLGQNQRFAQKFYDENLEYFRSMVEWFAEQTARWGTSNQKPISIVDKFFSSLAADLRRVLRAVAKAFGLPHAQFEAKQIISDWYNSFLTDADPLSGKVIIDRGWKKSYTQNARLLSKHPDFGGIHPKAGEVGAAAIAGLSRLFGGRANIPPAVGAVAATTDRWNALYRQLAGIQRLAELNKHIRQFGLIKELFQIAQRERQVIMDGAMETMREWDNLSLDESDNMMRMLDHYTNMKYIPQHQQTARNKIVRKPTNAELQAMVQQFKVTPKGLQLFIRIARDFQNFLNLMEQEAINDARKIRDPVKQAARIKAVQDQYIALRKIPYFPLMRFGEYTITVWNRQQPGPGRRVLRFLTAETEGEQRKIIRQMERQYAGNTLAWVQGGMLAKDSVPLLGMPQTMLDSIGRQLNLSPTQRDNLNQLKLAMSPADSFAHRFQHRKMTRGYSLDFKRAYAKYFFYGSGYLVRTRYLNQMKRTVASLRRTKYTMKDANNRDHMANFLAETVDIWTDPKPDWVTTRSFGFMMFIAFSPMSAALNLTQLPLTTYPLLASNFGDVQAIAAITNAGRKLSTFYKRANLARPLTSPGMHPDSEIQALGEAVAQGLIEEGQAKELAAMAEGNNLARRGGIDAISKRWNHVITAGSLMFRMTEQTNRRVTFRAAWALAQKQPGNKFVTESVQMEEEHYDRLVLANWSPQDAAAYVTAKRAVEMSQFIYTSSFIPRIMTGGRGSRSRGFRRTVLMFKNWTINSLFFMLDPTQKGAAIRSWLVLAFIGGAMGLPFAEDITELIRGLAWQLFGKDLDLEREAREMIIEMAGEDSSAADLLLNGTSRFGFGIPQMLDLMGGFVNVDVPMPTFDLSKATSMGQISPVPLGVLGPQRSPEAALARSAERASGPIGGYAFNVYKALTNTQLEVDDPKRWERVVQREMGAISRSYRAFSEGVERTPDGTTIATFNSRDTEQFLEMVGMAMGFTPTRLSAKYDLIAEQREVNAFWDLKRQAIIMQYRRAIQGKDDEEIQDAVGALKRYNREVPREFAGKIIRAESLRKSVRESTRMRVRKELGLGANKSEFGVNRTLQSSHPLASEAIEVRPVK